MRSYANTKDSMRSSTNIGIKNVPKVFYIINKGFILDHICKIQNAYYLVGPLPISIYTT